MRRAAIPMINSAAITSTTQAFVSLVKAHENAATAVNTALNHCQSSSNQNQLAIKSAMRDREIESASMTPSHKIISVLKLKRSIMPKAMGLSHESRTALAAQRARSPQQIADKAN